MVANCDGPAQRDGSDMGRGPTRSPGQACRWRQIIEAFRGRTATRWFSFYTVAPQTDQSTLAVVFLLSLHVPALQSLPVWKEIHHRG